jgi:hypothetical protein
VEAFDYNTIERNKNNPLSTSKLLQLQNPELWAWKQLHNHRIVMLDWIKSDGESTKLWQSLRSHRTLFARDLICLYYPMKHWMKSY